MKSYRSAPWIIWGIVLTVIGTAWFEQAYVKYTMEVLTSSGMFDEPSYTAVQISAVIAVVGLIVLVRGLWMLAKNVDNLAARLLPESPRRRVTYPPATSGTPLEIVEQRYPPEQA